MVVVPLHATRSYRRFKEVVRSGPPGTRARQYWKGIARQWIVTLCLLIYWWQVGRAFSALGFSLPGDQRTVWGLGITLIGGGFLFAQWRSVMGLEPKELAALASKAESVADLLPRGDEEARAFRVLAFTAGTCEEILYRGFLIAYLAYFLGAWPAVLVGGVAFGVAHAYQGAVGMVKTGIVGTFAGALLVGTGSLLWPMVLHTAIDLHGGAVGRRLLWAVDQVPNEA